MFRFAPRSVKVWGFVCIKGPRSFPFGSIDWGEDQSSHVFEKIITIKYFFADKKTNNKGKLVPEFQRFHRRG